MQEVDPKSVLATIEVIRAIKSLFAEQNPYLPMYGALAGAAIGAVSPFLANLYLARRKERIEKKSLTFQIYAEIKATIEIIEHRKYISHLEHIVDAFEKNQISAQPFLVQVQDDRHPIFKNSLDRLGIIDIEIQVMVVEFYQLLEAVIQDVKPGGLLNSSPAQAPAFQEALRISKRAHQVGKTILAMIDHRYDVPNSSASQ